MLDRTYLVPEGLSENIAGSAHPEQIIERLHSIKDEVTANQPVSQTPFEVELDALFSKTGEERQASEMERIVILLCKIAHRIIRMETVSPENQQVLLQIFELGLFLVQFKATWLARLESLGLLQEQNWTPPCSTPSKPLSEEPGKTASSRDLVSLAQEYILRRESVGSSRCDLCAFALANSTGAYHAGQALLLRQKPREDMQLVYFLAYVLEDLEESRVALLARWMSVASPILDATVIYVGKIITAKIFGVETSKIEDPELFKRAALSMGSHRALAEAGDALLRHYEQGSISGSELTSVITATYNQEDAESTEKLLLLIFARYPDAAEACAKSLIIFRRAQRLASFFLVHASRIDRDYAECLIVCRDELEEIPAAKLRVLCDSEFFLLLCKEDTVFHKILRRVSAVYEETTQKTAGDPAVITHGWNIAEFASRVVTSLPMKKKALEKSLLLIMYFPWISTEIKRMLWREIERRGFEYAVPDGALGLEEDVEVLNQFRDIPKIGRILLKIAKSHSIEPVLFNGNMDVFLAAYIRHRIRKTRCSLADLCDFLGNIREREEVFVPGYWCLLLKTPFVIGRSLRPLRAVLGCDKMLPFISNERDLLTVFRDAAKEKDHETMLQIVDKMDTLSKFGAGLVLGAGSYILISTAPLRSVSTYLTMTQKEFAGRQSVIKFQGARGCLEFLLCNGKMKLSHTEEVDGVLTEKSCEVDAEIEHHPFGGWKIHLAFCASPGGCTLQIGEYIQKLNYRIGKVSEILIGEEFRGILHRALVLEESSPKPERLSTKPSDVFYVENLVHVEKSLQYHKKFGALIETMRPYQFSGADAGFSLCNVLYFAPSFWRSSEKITDALAGLGARDPTAEQKILSYVRPQDTTAS